MTRLTWGMDEPGPQQPDFQQSFALIDAAGRLVDWDAGFEWEWANSAPRLRRGAFYGALLRAVAETPQMLDHIQRNYGHGDHDRFIEDQIALMRQERLFEYVGADGRIVLVEQRRTVSGGIQRLARDVTAERKTRQRLEASNAQAVGVFVEFRRLPDGNYVFPPISDELRRLVDLPEEFTGADQLAFQSRMLMSQEEISHSGARIEHAARTLETLSEEFRVRDGKGQVRWLRESMMPRREHDGTVVFSCVIRDVTREKQAEDQVALLHSVVVRSSDSIIILETDATPRRKATILYVNSRFIEMFGGSAEDLVGKPAEILLTDDRARASARQLDCALRREDGLPIEFEAQARDGTLFWVEARVEIVQKLDGGSFRWVITSRDITERRRAQIELLHAKEAAEAANRAKGLFLANMSHELRTPLNAIIGFSELIEQGVERSGWAETYGEYLRDISASGRHLLSLINTILDLSKIDAGMLQLECGAVDLDELLTTSVALVSGLAKDGGIEFTLKRLAEGVEIDGDFVKLKQVILNVLSNAIKFTPEGGKVVVTSHAEEARIRITVADTGCGISQADLARVAYPFVQVENSLSRRYPGTGLGLSIAKQLCELHGGELIIDSEEGTGTNVQIILPRLVGRLEAAAIAVQKRFGTL